MDKKKVIFVILTILLILGGVGAGVYLDQQSAEYREKAAPATTLALTTNNPNPELGQNVSVDVEINTGENRISGYELYILFDAQKLEALEVNPGTFLTDTQKIGPTIDNTNGTVYYVEYIFSGTADTISKQGQGKLATIIFKTKQSGTVQLTFDPVKTIVPGYLETGISGKSEADRTSVLIGATPLTINVLAATTPTSTPTPTTPAGVSPTAVPSPTSGIGGNGSVTPTQ